MRADILFIDQLKNRGQELLLRGAVLMHQCDFFQVQSLDEFLVYRGLDLLLNSAGADLGDLTMGGMTRALLPAVESIIHESFALQQSAP